MMNQKLKVYNSLTKSKETFQSINEDSVGMYVCGPTVYSDVHLGNCRTFVSFDIIFRYLRFLGYKVRYVRNITDVGHLEGDADIGREDKIAKKARLEQLEPMEVVHRYTIGFHDMMKTFNTLPPSIEPRATGHIIEQIEMIEDILKNGFAYVENGSVYFNTLKFAKETGEYGKLSGRIIEDLMAESRDNLKHQGEKRHPSDFAIWIKADPTHLMRWNSPWSVGFPGWHLECSAMSTKYLGQHFDIHGGGNDLKFPHHENEVAQNMGACKCTPAKYWLHSNMLLMNGRKMSKSDGNTITPVQLFTGESDHISKGYSPMIVRFFMLQSHYRSTLDLTDEALKAAEGGYQRLMQGFQVLQELQPTAKKDIGDTALDQSIQGLINQMHDEMDDDFNTPKTLARMFELVPKINGLKAGHLNMDEVQPETLTRLKHNFQIFIHDIFGLYDETKGGGENGENLVDGLMDIILDIRKSARTNKDWATSDLIRDSLGALSIKVKDSKEGSSWSKV